MLSRSSLGHDAGSTPFLSAFSAVRDRQAGGPLSPVVTGSGRGWEGAATACLRAGVTTCGPAGSSHLQAGRDTPSAGIGAASLSVPKAPHTAGRPPPTDGAAWTEPRFSQAPWSQVSSSQFSRRPVLGSAGPHVSGRPAPRPPARPPALRTRPRRAPYQFTIRAASFCAMNGRSPRASHTARQTQRRPCGMAKRCPAARRAEELPGPCPRKPPPLALPQDGHAASAGVAQLPGAALAGTPTAGSVLCPVPSGELRPGF